MVSIARYVFALLVAVFFAARVLAGDGMEDGWDVNFPPGQTREVEIHTTSGTWMSLDVSPDGKTIAFDLLGDIYLLPIGGGAARAIDNGLAWSMQPRFSPDGSEIAYISDAGGGNNVWIMRVDGSHQRQLTDENVHFLNNPTWSPDGDYIAARKHYTTERALGTGEIWLYHVKGGNGVAVVERPDGQHQKELGEPVFAPDGRGIYFTRDNTPGAVLVYARDSNTQLFEIDRYNFGTGKTQSVVTGAGGAVRPAPSPDGKHLAFVRRLKGRSALFIKNLESGVEAVIYERLDQDMQEIWGVQGLYPNMDWTPDSRAIVFWAGGKIRRIDIESRQVVEIPFEVNDTRTVFDPPRPALEVAPDVFDARMLRNVSVSPDATQVVFEAVGRLYHKNLPDGRVQRLTRGDDDHFEFFPSWSRDGEQIVFVSWNDRELGHICTVPAQGGHSRCLTRRPGHYVSPRFSPDSAKIVYEAVKGDVLTSPAWSNEVGVFLISARGGEARRVTSDGTHPHFGARADRLYVTRVVDDASALVSIGLDGEAPHTHVIGRYATRFDVAPDDRHLAFRENYQIYALPLPPGGKSVEIGAARSGLPVRRASGDGGNYPQWSQGGATLYWSLGANLYRSPVADFFAADGYTAPTVGQPLAVSLSTDRPTGVLALSGARIVTMVGPDGGIIDNGVVVVDGNRIRAVGVRGDVDIPGGAAVIDVGGKTIIPGLIDTHTHVLAGENGIVPQQNWKNYATLAFGVTTVQDPYNHATDIFAAAQMQRTGRILAPRIFSTGDVLYGSDSPKRAVINSLEDARRHVRRLKAQGATSIKNYIRLRRRDRQQIAAAAREENILVQSAAASLYHLYLSLIADGNSTIEHNLPQSMLYDDVVQFWSQTRVSYTPTLVVSYGGLGAASWWNQETEVWRHPLLSKFAPPNLLRADSVRRTLAPSGEYHYPRIGETTRILADRGVPISVGSEGVREGLATHWEIWSLAQTGLSPLEALGSATIVAARELGFERDLGTLEAGKLADLVVIDADVLDDVRGSDKVSLVMLNGRLYDARTLDEVATGDRRTRPFYWQRRQ